MAWGTAAIFGGEAMCILGPLRFERQVHVLCHAILYFGIGMVVVGAIAHFSASRLKA